VILVTVGTHHQPFDRLVSAASRWSRLERVVVQRGSSRASPVGCHIVDHATPDQMAAWIAEARVVVTHAGPATVSAVWSVGRAPIVVPRRASLGEHVDDHQVRWAASIADRAVVVDDPDAIDALLADPPPREVPVQRDPDAFAAEFGALVARVLSARSAGRRS
jgi:UDP-N-acetylglucosamine transferase subunit ALG13